MGKIDESSKKTTAAVSIPAPPAVESTPEPTAVAPEPAAPAAEAIPAATTKKKATATTAKTAALKKPAAKKATGKKPAGKKKKEKKAPKFSADDIALRAYFISEHRHHHGLPGDAHSDWIEAERQLAKERRNGSKKS